MTMDITPILNVTNNNEDVNISTSSATRSSTESFDEIYTYIDPPAVKGLDIGDQRRSCEMKQQNLAGSSSGIIIVDAENMVNENNDGSQETQQHHQLEIELPDESEFLDQAPVPPELLAEQHDLTSVVELKKPDCDYSVVVCNFMDPPAAFSIEKRANDNEKVKTRKKNYCNQIRNTPDIIMDSSPDHTSPNAPSPASDLSVNSSNERQIPSGMNDENLPANPILADDSAGIYQVPEASVVIEIPTAVAVVMTSPWWMNGIKIRFTGSWWYLLLAQCWQRPSAYHLALYEFLVLLFGP